MAKKTFPCFLCEKLHAEIEDAEVCERSHANERVKGDDDGTEYSDPRDERDEPRHS